MAPSPEDDNTPKAPDKSDKNKCDKVITDEIVREKDKEEKVSIVEFFLWYYEDLEPNYWHFLRSSFYNFFFHQKDVENQI